MPMLWKKLVRNHPGIRSAETQTKAMRVQIHREAQQPRRSWKADTAEAGRQLAHQNPAVVTHVAPRMVSFSTRCTVELARAVVGNFAMKLHALVDAHDDHRRRTRSGGARCRRHRCSGRLRTRGGPLLMRMTMKHAARGSSGTATCRWPGCHPRSCGAGGKRCRDGNGSSSRRSESMRNCHTRATICAGIVATAAAPRIPQPKPYEERIEHRIERHREDRGVHRPLRMPLRRTQHGVQSEVRMCVTTLPARMIVICSRGHSPPWPRWHRKSRARG